MPPRGRAYCTWMPLEIAGDAVTPVYYYARQLTGETRALILIGRLTALVAMMMISADGLMNEFFQVLDAGFGPSVYTVDCRKRLRGMPDDGGVRRKLAWIMCVCGVLCDYGRYGLLQGCATGMFPGKFADFTCMRWDEEALRSV